MPEIVLGEFPLPPFLLYAFLLSSLLKTLSLAPEIYDIRCAPSIFHVVIALATIFFTTTWLSFVKTSLYLGGSHITSQLETLRSAGWPY